MQEQNIEQSIEKSQCSQFNINKISEQFSEKIQLSDELSEEQTKNSDQPHHLAPMHSNLIINQNYIHSDQSVAQFENNYFPDSNTIILDGRFAQHLKKFISQKYSIDNFGDLLSFIHSDDIVAQHHGVIGIRKLLSVQNSPPIQLVIDAGLVSILIGYIFQKQYPQLQFQACWALTNVTSGTQYQCATVINSGAIPVLLQLLKCPYTAIAEQSMWALGNIAGDRTLYRDMILEQNGVSILASVIYNNMNQKSIVNNGAWALSNFCRGKPLPKYELVKQAVPIFSQILASDTSQGQNLQVDCLWALAYVCGPQKYKFTKQTGSDLLTKIINILHGQKNVSVLSGALKSLQSILEDNQQMIAQYLKKEGSSEVLYLSLCHSKKTIRRSTCLVIQAITMLSSFKPEFLFDDKNLLIRLLELFDTAEVEIVEEICYVFANMSNSTFPELIYSFFMQTKILKYYVKHLQSPNAGTVLRSLQCLDEILEIGNQLQENQKNPFITMLEEFNGAYIIEKLQMHPSHEVYDLTIKLLQDYYACEQFNTDMEDPIQQQSYDNANNAPNSVSSQSLFSFNTINQNPGQFHFGENNQSLSNNSAAPGGSPFQF